MTRWQNNGTPLASRAPATPYDTSYGMREAVHVDPDNNLIRFGSRLKKN
jgi:hypothetical protein